jgi:exodeoxyribonuclease V alpha subunit
MPPPLAPDLDWLKNRWNLTDPTIPFIGKYLDAESDGSTALEVPGDTDPADWGNAASVTTAGAAAPTHPKPLVVIQNGERLFLQSWRNYKAELEIAQRLRCRFDGEFDMRNEPGQLMMLFPGAKKGDLQIKAVEVALRQRLTLITGGPGTGKTHTLVRILTMLVEGGISASKIRLAAPTGKAADRMKKAVGESLESLPPDFRHRVDDLKAVANRSSTLHSLLGYNPSTGKCRFDDAHPLPCEVLIVDECSMVDVLLWRALLNATPDNARLILVGDPNQLESVGRGNVLAELANVAGDVKSPLHGFWVHLTEARRFKDRPGILALASALEKMDAEEAVKLLSEAKGTAAPAGIAWLDISGSSLSWSAFPESIQNALIAVAEAETPQAAMDALGRICILTAQREYFVGSKAMSETIEKHFLGGSPVTRRRNQPIIINQNDPETGLRNGSIGVIAIGTDGTRKACFPGLKDKAAIQEFSVAKLPDYSLAWALTIHRSQGSEFDEVLVVLPWHGSPMATRELIYTAITRAKKAVYIAGNLESIRKAAANPSSRVTLVGAHLRP